MTSRETFVRAGPTKRNRVRAEVSSARSALASTSSSSCSSTTSSSISSSLSSSTTTSLSSLSHARGSGGASDKKYDPPLSPSISDGTMTPAGRGLIRASQDDGGFGGEGPRHGRKTSSKFAMPMPESSASSIAYNNGLGVSAFDVNGSNGGDDSFYRYDEDAYDDDDSDDNGDDDFAYSDEDGDVGDAAYMMHGGQQQRTDLDALDEYHNSKKDQKKEKKKKGGGGGGEDGGGDEIATIDGVDFIVHHVERTDSLQSICVHYSVTVNDIKRINKLFSDLSLFSRDTILVPMREHMKGKKEESDEALRRELALEEFLSIRPDVERHEALLFLKQNRFYVGLALEKYEMNNAMRAKRRLMKGMNPEEDTQHLALSGSGGGGSDDDDRGNDGRGRSGRNGGGGFTDGGGEVPRRPRPTLDADIFQQIDGLLDSISSSSLGALIPTTTTSSSSTTTSSSSSSSTTMNQLFQSSPSLPSSSPARRHNTSTPSRTPSRSSSSSSSSFGLSCIPSPHHSPHTSVDLSTSTSSPAPLNPPTQQRFVHKHTSQLAVSDDGSSSGLGASDGMDRILGESGESAYGESNSAGLLTRMGFSSKGISSYFGL
eukprot:TRINITY_DN811_c0_g10_i1.p1 TRINITY_DN811_c0_g10~~TRINITY_DN811_c0_g10_i1.p1  ORF type:complete len:599 (+),score=210.49 TRINITY_DN811_c0_g10_i1:451-2247(+)